MAKTPAKAAEAATKETRAYEPAQVTNVSADVPMPEGLGRSRRGGRSQYPFDSLEVGQSFGVKNKSLAQMNSTISTANKRHRTERLDDDGNIIYKTQDVKQADGSVVKQPTLDPEMIAGRVFAGADVDPKTDPEGASVRIWRKA